MYAASANLNNNSASKGKGSQLMLNAVLGSLTGMDFSGYSQPIKVFSLFGLGMHTTDNGYSRQPSLPSHATIVDIYGSCVYSGLLHYQSVSSFTINGRRAYSSYRPNYQRKHILM